MVNSPLSFPRLERLELIRTHMNNLYQKDLEDVSPKTLLSFVQTYIELTNHSSLFNDELEFIKDNMTHCVFELWVHDIDLLRFAMSLNEEINTTFHSYNEF